MISRDRAEGRNVLGSPLLPCSVAPLTGFFRDACCNTGPEDHGLHVVCVEITADFLAYSQSRGNDLMTPIAEIGFAGLKPGDAILKEEPKGPYVNVIAVRSADKDKPWVATLVESYRSPEVKTFIDAKFGGAVLTSW